MRSLWRFLSRFSTLFVFLSLQVIAFWLMSRHTNMQKVRLMNASIEIVGTVHNISSSWRDYFTLRETNRNLSEENTRLFAEVEYYKHLYHDAYTPDLSKINEAIELAKTDSTTIDVNGDFSASAFSDSVQFQFISARVINNSFSRANNFITLSKGSQDGIAPEMGIIGPDGVVGIVTSVSDNYSIGPSLLNSRWSVSAKIQHSKYFGTLAWDGKDPKFAQLQEIPFHVQVSVGDTLVTSGYSDVFPEGIPIATIDTFKQSEGSNFLVISAKLLTNFQNLSYVTVVCNRDLAEIETLNQTTKNDE